MQSGECVCMHVELTLDVLLSSAKHGVCKWIIPDQGRYMYENLARRESLKETVPWTAVSILHGEISLLQHNKWQHMLQISNLLLHSFK